jgi:hypothetical protein
MDLPTMTVYGPKGKVIINVSDLPAWQQKGYTTLPPAPAASRAASPAAPKALDAMTLEELRKQAEPLGIPSSGKLNKGELLEVLRTAAQQASGSSLEKPA